ncbi:amyloid beta A4 precursor protein-binding family B member 1-interacting protein-like [Melanotaenia boesemani]|uniref:amyloid beta A4 precursor protein-binding family B member 1-interacting protein-like n=1 Tax=Melanotaenia boesemani TaxID=1250792 RepID=UPI001C059FA8|nr:amyloid beta A4 precursor protein-binding family B member 1-interacting protein-like [Melanotaenia boesemani]
MDDIDALFSDLLGEMDNLSQSLTFAVNSSEVAAASQGSAFSVSFIDLNESLNDLEDHDLDVLVADLESKLTSQESSMNDESSSQTNNQTSPAVMTSEPAVILPTPTAESSRGINREPQTKGEKIKLALEKLKEAKVRKLIVKVLLTDNSSKTLMVDERQTVRQVLDKLFEKTHCDFSIDWSLCESNPELQIERGFEDHENLVESLSAWTRRSENKIHFVSKPQKYMMFTEPQIFYMRKKEKDSMSEIKSQNKELLIKENFGGLTVIVPDLEGTLYLKEDGKKVWKPRFFVLRASGIYYVPKGKTKSSTDLVCFTRLGKVNVYTTSNYKQKFRAPTNFCFLLKHPCIQKESPHIRFLCCDDEHTLLLWVNSIRIGKYGTQLYENYRDAVQRMSTLQTLLSAAHKDRSNGHTPLARPHPGSSPPKSTNIDDYPHEPPPDFIPPPPPEHKNV